MIMFILGITLGMYGMSFINILFLSMLVTGISFVGDMIILPRYGNLAATIGDFGIVFFIVLFGSAYLMGNEGRIGLGAFLPALIIALGESFLHKYIQKNVFNEEDISAEPELPALERDKLQTEFGSEPDFEKTDHKPTVHKKRYVPHRPRKRNKKNPY